MHNVIAYDFSLNRYHRLKIEVYRQYLYDIPIDTDTNSTFSTLNSRGGINNYELNNKGKGYNYGIELTIDCGEMPDSKVTNELPTIRNCA